MGLNLTYCTNDYRNLRERNEGCLVSVTWYIVIHLKFHFSNITSVMLNQTNSQWLSFQSLEQKKQYIFSSQKDLQ